MTAYELGAKAAELGQVTPKKPYRFAQDSSDTLDTNIGRLFGKEYWKNIQNVFSNTFNQLSSDIENDPTKQLFGG